MEFMLSCDDKQGVMYVFAVENSSNAFLNFSVSDLNMPVKSVKICIVRRTLLMIHIGRKLQLNMNFDQSVHSLLL